MLFDGFSYLTRSDWRKRWYRRLSYNEIVTTPLMRYYRTIQSQYLTKSYCGKRWYQQPSYITLDSARLGKGDVGRRLFDCICNAGTTSRYDTIRYNEADSVSRMVCPLFGGMCRSSYMASRAVLGLHMHSMCNMSRRGVSCRDYYLTYNASNIHLRNRTSSTSSQQSSSILIRHIILDLFLPHGFSIQVAVTLSLRYEYELSMGSVIT